MAKRKPVEETPVSKAWREALTGPPPRIGGVTVEMPSGEPIEVRLEDLYPLVCEPEVYISEMLCSVVVEILGELEHRKYVNQMFENDLMSFYFGPSGEDLRDQVKADAAGRFTLIGLCGAAGSGKDTAASFLVAAGWTRIAFADPLKAVLYDMHVQVTTPDEYIEDLSDMVDKHGWDWCKTNIPEARALLQRLGVAVRDHVNGDSWLDAATKKMVPGGKYVVTDCRFPNELTAVRELGGKLVLIDRPGQADIAGNHISETGWRDEKFDVHIINSGSLEDLGAMILGAV